MHSAITGPSSPFADVATALTVTLWSNNLLISTIISSGVFNDFFQHLNAICDLHPGGVLKCTIWHLLELQFYKHH